MKRMLVMLCPVMVKSATGKRMLGRYVMFSDGEECDKYDFDEENIRYVVSREDKQL